MFYHMSFSLQRTLPPSFSDVTAAVLASPRFVHKLQMLFCSDAHYDSLSTKFYIS